MMVYSIRITGRRCCSPRINSALVKPCIRQPPRYRFQLHNTPYRPYRPTPFRFSTAHCYNHQFLRFRSTGFTPWSFRRSFTTETHQTTGKDMVDPTWDSDDEAGSVHTPGNVDEHLVQLIRVHSQKRPTRPGIDLLPKSRQARSADDVYPYNLKLATLVPTISSVIDMKTLVKVLHHMHIHKVKPDIVTYNTLLAIFVRGHKYHLIPPVLNRMKREGVKRDAVTRHILLYWHVRCNDPLRAMRIFNEMAKNDEHMSASTFNLLILLHSNTYDWSAAWDYVYFMKRVGIKPTTATYTTLIAAYSKIGDYLGMQRVIKFMMDEGVPILSATLDTVLKSLMVASTGEQEITLKLSEQAENIVEKFREAGVHPTHVTYMVILKMCAQDRDPKRARNIIERMKKGLILDANGNPMYPYTYHYSLLIHTHMLAGELERVKPILQEMIALKLYPDAKTWAIILADTFAVQKTELALIDIRNMFEFLVSRGRVVPETPKLDKKSKHKRVFASLDEIIPEMYQAFYEDVDFYNAIIRAHYYAGDERTAYLYVRKLTSAESVSKDDKIKAIKLLINMGFSIDLKKEVQLMKKGRQETVMRDNTSADFKVLRYFM